MTKIALTITRKGEFEILPTQFHEKQCGMNTRQKYEYKVTIEASNKRLIQPDMFVLDNMVVKEYFDRTYVQNREVCRSCEVMACDAVEYFKSLFIGKCAPYKFVDVNRIFVLISGSEHSFITANWEKKNDKSK